MPGNYVYRTSASKEPSWISPKKGTCVRCIKQERSHNIALPSAIKRFSSKIGQQFSKCGSRNAKSRWDLLGGPHVESIFITTTSNFLIPLKLLANLKTGSFLWLHFFIFLFLFFLVFCFFNFKILHVFLHVFPNMHPPPISLVPLHFVNF